MPARSSQLLLKDCQDGASDNQIYGITKSICDQINANIDPSRPSQSNIICMPKRNAIVRKNKRQKIVSVLKNSSFPVLETVLLDVAPSQSMTNKRLKNDESNPRINVVWTISVNPSKDLAQYLKAELMWECRRKSPLISQRPNACR